MTKTALFFNISNKPFTGYWDGKPKTFKPGQKEYMPEWLANHYAKHLTNQILIEKGLENYTSPKRPKDVPQFMEIFEKIVFVEADAEEKSELDNEIEIANRRRQPSSDIEPVRPMIVDKKEPQIITPPEGDGDEEDNFEGLGDNKQGQ